MRHESYRVWVVVALGALGAIGLLLAPALYVADLQEALVREANSLVAAPRPRGSHVAAPAPGRLSEALRPVLPGYQRDMETLTGKHGGAGILSAVALGERPPADLSPEALVGLNALEGQLDQVLAASRAASADLGPDHDAFSPLAGTSWLGLQSAAKHAAIRIWLAPTPALRARQLPSCLDGLALGRDAAIAGGLVGRMIRASLVRLLEPACAEALAASPVGAMEAAADGLRRIRDAVPDFATMMREEAVQVQLLIYGPGLPEKLRMALLDRPRAFVADGSMAPPDALRRLRFRATWRLLRWALADLVVAAGVPPREQDEAFAAAYRRHWYVLWLLGVPEADDPGGPHAAYARRDVAAGLRLDLLVAAAAARQYRARHGGWPESAGALLASGLLTAEEGVRLAGLLLAEEERGRSLRVLLRLPRGAHDEPPGEASSRVCADTP